jgi:hypothetical protein
MKQSDFSKRDLNQFGSAEGAYHQLVYDIAKQQFHSTQLVLSGTNVRQIFVDGGLARIRST